MKPITRLTLLALLLIGLPLAGVWATGGNVTAYLEFPPRTQYVEHAPFSWPVFIVLAIVILGVVLPFLIRVGKAQSRSATRTTRRSVPTQTFPWWGGLATGLGSVFWMLAWTRFEWFAPFQLYTYIPLWFCYIVAINALTYRRTGRCLMTHASRFFLKLFPLSAVFWWFFEYLNRFVQNWYYVECGHFSPLQYFITATLSFSTVLPAVLSTEEWLASHPQCSAGLKDTGYIKCLYPRTLAWMVLTLSSLGLLLIGRFPNQLFPLLWVAPLLLLMAFNTLLGKPSFFPEVMELDFRRVFRLALAALICGFFWEMWNYYSLAKWIYTIPYVHRFQLFEMPILGYAGYLPFGLECAVIADLICRRNHG